MQPTLLDVAAVGVGVVPQAAGVRIRPAIRSRRVIGTARHIGGGFAVERIALRAGTTIHRVNGLLLLVSVVLISAPLLGVLGPAADRALVALQKILDRQHAKAGHHAHGHHAQRVAGAGASESRARGWLVAPIHRLQVINKGRAHVAAAGQLEAGLDLAAIGTADERQARRRRRGRFRRRILSVQTAYHAHDPSHYVVAAGCCGCRAADLLQGIDETAVGRGALDVRLWRRQDNHRLHVATVGVVALELAIDVATLGVAHADPGDRRAELAKALGVGHLIDVGAVGHVAVAGCRRAHTLHGTRAHAGNLAVGAGVAIPLGVFSCLRGVVQRPAHRRGTHDRILVGFRQHAVCREVGAHPRHVAVHRAPRGAVGRHRIVAGPLAHLLGQRAVHGVVDHVGRIGQEGRRHRRILVVEVLRDVGLGAEQAVLLRVVRRRGSATTALVHHRPRRVKALVQLLQEVTDHSCFSNTA